MKFIIEKQSTTAFVNSNNVYQDGTTPMYRDVDGKLWAMSGHSHKGVIAMFCGSCIDDMQLVYPIETNFCVGNAEYAFSGIRYPEGVKPRGSIWPFGLYICPNTHRFFCFFHNETGWNGKGTAYDALGPCQKPHFDSDFRHIGLMHSDDEGKNWTFDRWVLTSDKVCFTELYNPENDCMIGQKAGHITLGSGDFSLFVEPDGEYIYLIYSMVRVDTDSGCWDGCDAYIARTRKRTDGVMGDFVKYYNGAFCEAGNLGKESIIIKNAWHPRMVWLEKYKKYVMTSCPVNEGASKNIVRDIMQIRFSDDMLNWSEPQTTEFEGKAFGNHYVALVSNDTKSPPNVITGDTLAALTNHNGTDVLQFAVRIGE